MFLPQAIGSRRCAEQGKWTSPHVFNGFTVPWLGGPKLISLLDMKEYLAPRLTSLARNLYDVQASFMAG